MLIEVDHLKVPKAQIKVCLLIQQFKSKGYNLLELVAGRGRSWGEEWEYLKEDVGRGGSSIKWDGINRRYF